MGRYDYIEWLKRPKSYTDEEFDKLPLAERTQIERQWRNYNDIKNSLDTARRQGMIEGLKECCARVLMERQKVINQSCADGKELLSTEVDECLLRVARRLLLLDVPVREVSQCTLLPVEYLSKMKERNGRRQYVVPGCCCRRAFPWRIRLTLQAW